MQVEKKILAEVMTIFVTAAMIYGLQGERSLALLLYWNIFAYMVIEDFKYQEVDLRCVIMLILFSAAAAGSLGKYILEVISGMIIFRIMYVATTKIYEANEVFTKCGARRSRHGYLPSLGAGLIISLMIEKIIPQPKILQETVKGFKEVFEFILEVPELIGVLIILLAGLWLVLEWRIKTAEKANKQIIYSWGMGDVLVLGIMGGVLGEKIFAVFFVSLWVQLAEFFFERVEWGVREN